jgi:hypothetical protein
MKKGLLFLFFQRRLSRKLGDKIQKLFLWSGIAKIGSKPLLEEEKGRGILLGKDRYHRKIRLCVKKIFGAFNGAKNEHIFLRECAFCTSPGGISNLLAVNMEPEERFLECLAHLRG